MENNKRKRVSGDSARERLIDAAIDEFARRGFEGARVNSIAAAARINKQLVYHYFGSKEKLHREALAAAYARFRGDDEALASLGLVRDPIEALTSFVDHLFPGGDGGLCFSRLLQDENMRGAPSVKKIDGIAESYLVLLNALTDILKRGFECGCFRKVADVREFYVSLVGVFGIRQSNAHTLSISLKLPLTTEEGAKASRRAALDFVLSAIAAPNAGPTVGRRPATRSQRSSRRL